MRNLRLAVVALSVTLFSSSFYAQEAPISRDQVDAYLKNTLEKYSPADSQEWRVRMYRLLVANRDPDATASALAQQDQLSVSSEKALMSLWLAHAELESSSIRGKAPDDYNSQLQAIRQRALTVVRATGHAPMAITMAIFVSNDWGCGLESFERLIADAPNVLDAGLSAANYKGCLSWWLSLHSRFPENAEILAALAQLRDLTTAEKLAVLERLNSSGKSDDRIRDYVTQLWNGGLIAEGLAVLDAAPENDRQRILNSSAGSNDRGEDLRLDYIAALYLTGRSDDASKAFEQLPETSRMRPLWDCIGRQTRRTRGGTSDRCDEVSLNGTWGLVESLLNRQSEDPYLLIEGGPNIDWGSALWVEIARRRLNGDNYEALRRQLAQRWMNSGPREPERAALLARFMESEFHAATAAYERKMSAAVAHWGVTRTVESTVSRQRRASSPPPLPQGSRELSVPDDLRTTRNDRERPPAWPSDMASLPKGFSPVRAERQEQNAIAVSLSQNLDPVGEVSQGGYWIHLSRDRGKSWDDPVYTGLLEYFPYVVMPTSKIQMLAGDRIKLEVVVQELDTSSITYPPVSLRSARRAPDLYLEIPLASLQADRDHDGLTDIVESHLLLDPDQADSDGDGVEDGRDALPNVKNTEGLRDRDYITSILQHIFRMPERAIIEPVDRGPGIDSIALGKFAIQPGPMRPILIEGNPADFAGLRPASMVFVYSDGDLDRLRAHSPDFHALALGTPVFNRARDRGYVSWSLGWTGGTLRVVREGDTWRVEEISSWVT